MVKGYCFRRADGGNKKERKVNVAAMVTTLERLLSTTVLRLSRMTFV